jgi:hypothetical protein
MAKPIHSPKHCADEHEDPDNRNAHGRANRGRPQHLDGEPRDAAHTAPQKAQTARSQTSDSVSALIET